MFQSNLNELMKEYKINFSQLSSETGISRQALTSLANNESKGVQFQTLEALTNFFHCTLDDLFTKKGQKIILDVIFKETQNQELVSIWNISEDNKTFSKMFLTAIHYDNFGDLSIIELISLSEDIHFKFNKIEDILMNISENKKRELAAFIFNQFIKIKKDGTVFEDNFKILVEFSEGFTVYDVDLDFDNNKNQYPIVNKIKDKQNSIDSEIYFINFD